MMKHPGLKYIAGFEFLKGICALIITIGLLDIRNEPEFISHSEPRSFRNLVLSLIEKLDGLRSFQFHLLLTVGLIYSVLRLLEGYGLMREKNWGRKIGIWSACLYLPFELLEIVRDFSLLKLTVTLVNVLIVVYLLKTKLKDIH